MNLALQNLETWELQQAIIAVNQAQKHQVDFIRGVLRRHRLEVLRLAVMNGSKIQQELLNESFHPLVGSQAPDRTALNRAALNREPLNREPLNREPLNPKPPYD